jgi:DNA ligase-associated metallophosphoesterase
MTKNYLDILVEGQPFFLLPQRAAFRPDLRQLVIADLHLGKTTHFRKQGMALPETGLLKDIDKLHFLINKWRPVSVLLLGDLFHSDYNREWLWFKSLLKEYEEIKFILAEGNHDILEDKHYSMPNLLKTEILVEDNFVFSHHPLENCSRLNICGHIHPGIEIHAKAKQYFKLPCFYLNANHFIFPAFGHLTGLYILEQEQFSNYFLIAGDKVVHYKV